jgi:hypothetical protein
MTARPSDKYIIAAILFIALLAAAASVLFGRLGQ